MSVNFNLLDPNMPANSAGSVYAGQQQQQQNQLAKQQLQQSQMQTEKTGMDIQKMRSDQAALQKMQQAFVANGKSPDLESNFNEMIQSGIPHFVDIGTKGLQTIQAQKQFAAIMGGPSAAGAAPAAPAVAPEAGANALAPVAPVAAAPVNALAPKPEIAAMRQKRDQLLAMGTTQSIAAARALDADIALASKPPVLHTVGNVLVGPDGKPVYTGVSAPTNLAKLQAEMAALPPGDPRRAQYEALIRKETTHAPAVSVTNVQEKAEAGAYGKVLVDQYSDLSKAANLAVKTLPSIESNLSILNKGLDTGFGTEAKAAGAKILGALGVQNAEQYATNAQTFQSNALQGVLQKQLEQKGPQTESDAQRIQQIGAQLGKTKAANEFILLTAKEQLQRDIDQRNFYADWRKKTNSFEGAESAWFAGEGGKSLFDRPALKKFAVSGGAAAQIPTTVAPARAPVAPATTAITNPKFPGFSIGKP